MNRPIEGMKIYSMRVEDKQVLVDIIEGGFLNGWSIHNTPHYDIDQVTHDTEIGLCRTQEIKYDVKIEE